MRQLMRLFREFASPDENERRLALKVLLRLPKFIACDDILIAGRNNRHGRRRSWQMLIHCLRAVPYGERSITELFEVWRLLNTLRGIPLRPKLRGTGRRQKCFARHLARELDEITRNEWEKQKWESANSYLFSWTEQLQEGHAEKVREDAIERVKSDDFWQIRSTAVCFLLHKFEILFTEPREILKLEVALRAVPFEKRDQSEIVVLILLIETVQQVLPADFRAEHSMFNDTLRDLRRYASKLL